MKSAQLTGEWESKLKAIESGSHSPDTFMQSIEQFTREIIDTSDANEIREEEIGPCPLCGAPIIEGKQGFGCSEWKKGCGYVLWKDQNGIKLRREQVQRLLQKGVLLSPIGRSIYTLTKNGHVQTLDTRACHQLDK